MKLRININDLIHAKNVEWEHLEFKAGWHPLAVLHTLCAFANDFRNLGGDYIVFGVAEHEGEAVLPPTGLGTSEMDAIQKEVLDLGHHPIPPFYHPIILDAMKRNGSPPPEFEFGKDHSYFMTRLPAHPGARAAADKTSVAGEVGTKSALSRHQVIILRMCLKESPLIELLELTRRSERIKFRDQVLNPLLVAQLIEMTIPDKPKSRFQKYRLTEKGRVLLMACEKSSIS